jgi:hypothetical protein
LGDPIALPFTAVITSPASMPAASAGVLQIEPTISVPELTGAMEVGAGMF